MPLAVSSPIFSRSRRLVSPAAISSCRFLKALTICLKRPLETFSPNTLKYTGYLLSSVQADAHRSSTKFGQLRCLERSGIFSDGCREMYVPADTRVNHKQLAEAAFANFFLSDSDCYACDTATATRQSGARTHE